MVKTLKHFYEFGSFRIDANRRLLFRDSEPVSLTPKVFDTLLVLIQNSGQVLEKDLLMQKVWPDTIVEENNLSQNISALRRIFGENRGEHQFIVTVPGKGYRFVADVNELWEEPSGPLPTRIEVPGTVAHTNGYPSGQIANQVLSANIQSVPVPPQPHPRHWRPASRFALAFVLFAALGVVMFYFVSPRGTRSAVASVPVKSIAVLPFKLLGGESGDDYLGVSLADALITKLSNIREIAVRPTDTVLKYGSQNIDFSSAGRELAVDALLEGTVQHSGDRIRVTVQLVSVQDGSTFWADKYDQQFTSIFDVQDKISEHVASKLALKLSSEEQQLLTKKFTENPDAYQAYLKGRYYWNKRTSAALDEALKHFQEAKDIDPGYALAYAGLADTYVMLGHRYDSAEDQREAYPKAKIAATRALQLNDMLAEAHSSLAVVKQRYDWDWTGSEQEYKRALELNPNYSTAYQMYSSLLISMGRLDEALMQLKHAQDIDPQSYSINTDLGVLYYSMRDYDKVIEQFRHTLNISPNDPYSYVAHRYLGWSYEAKGLHDESEKEFLKSMEVQGTDAGVLNELNKAYKEAGLKTFWQKWLLLHQDRITNRRVSPTYLSIIYAFLGDKDQAFKWLQTAYDDRSIVLATFRFDSHFDDLRSDPRYKDLFKRFGLPS